MAVFAHSTHVSPPERAAFRAVVDAGFADVVRPHAPGPGVYTYWDYTQLRFPAGRACGSTSCSARPPSPIG
ncbi:hypothetical protein [Blastococcus brunescens]|uniref:Uncharacterized protein n=1 Tax=Blastococcus brunescens TaxID=1564165 RepID=A0ABZ1AYM5_9ACTN|nr:hypothetical protein [Blastococcus sp. BMG 8361]WRL63673.1 hypothetical protein U6N30_29085 [Blastococcus sp. BMG 8361]